MLKSNIKVLAVIISLMSTQNQAMETPLLSPAFLGKKSYLQKVREIQRNPPATTAFMPELQPIVEEIVGSFSEKITQTPALSQHAETMDLFKKMDQYAKDEFSNKTMNLNRLNYLCLQMSILLNPNLN